MKNKNGIPVANKENKNFNLHSKVSSESDKHHKPYWAPFSPLSHKTAEIEFKSGSEVVSIIMPYVWTEIKQYLNEGWVLKGSWVN